MYKTIIKDRLTSEETNQGTFETLEKSNEWISKHTIKGINGNAWGRYFGERTYPKKGLNYENEVEFNDLLLKENSDYVKEITPSYTQALLEKDEEGNYILDEEGTPIPTGEVIEHEAVTQTWVNLHPEYIYEISDITEEYESEQADLALIKSGKDSTNKCNKVLNYISGYNQSSNFTLEQINTMISTFSGVNAYLRAGMPETALLAASAAIPDGVVVTEELKTKIVSMLTI